MFSRLTARFALQRVGTRALSHHAVLSASIATPTPAITTLSEEARLAAVAASLEQAPRYEPLIASPFPTKVQAWLHEFETGRPIGIHTLDKRVFDGPQRVDLMHRAVIWQRDGMRQGTAATKGISDIRGTTRKAAPQKGRGKARVGTYRAPQFRGGATVFGPKPRDHSTDLPRKVWEAALRSALATKYQQGQLLLVDALRVKSHKTRDFYALLGRYLWQDTTVLMATGYERVQRKLELASRNLQNVECTTADELDVYRI
jgi:large subunit ribosomal protein L4